MPGDRPPPRGTCVLLTVADDVRRQQLRAALEVRGVPVRAVSTPNDALVIGFAEQCDVLVVEVNPERGVALPSAIGLAEWLRQRHGDGMRAVALTPGQDSADVRRALTSGFDVVFGPLVEPETVAEAVARLRGNDEADVKANGGQPAPAG